MRSYRYIRLTPRNRAAFFDNLVAAYHALQQQQQSESITTSLSMAELKELVLLICEDFPQDALHLIQQVVLQQTPVEQETTRQVSFQEFAAAVNACLVLEGIFRIIL